MNQSVFAWVLIATSLLLLLRCVTRLFGHAEQLCRLQHFPVRQQGGGLAGFNSWLVRLCYFFGGGINPLVVAFGVGFSAISAATACWYVTQDIVYCAVVPVLWSAAVLTVMSILRKRGLEKFESQFPAALDLFSRAIRAGESVDQAMHLLANAGVGQPAEREFRRCAGHLEMGLSLSATLTSLCDRLDITDVRIFSAAMTAHRDGGGQLVPTLERLAAVIRDRANYRQQLKTVTGASRISVFIIAALGPILFGWLFLIHPEYGSKLWSDSTGRILLVYAIVSEVIGLMTVAALMKTDY